MQLQATEHTAVIACIPSLSTSGRPGMIDSSHAQFSYSGQRVTTETGRLEQD